MKVLQGRYRGRPSVPVGSADSPHLKNNQCRGYRVRVPWDLGPLGIPRHATFANVRTFSPTLEPDDGLASAPGPVTPYTGGFLVAGVLCRWPGLLSELRISLLSAGTARAAGDRKKELLLVCELPCT